MSFYFTFEVSSRVFAVGWTTRDGYAAHYERHEDFLDIGILGFYLLMLKL